ncbi:DJ-1/PfpI family protein [Burkholderia sp. Ac-20353]|uniref:DJ-1/PfpI family protein n=1 Tax=Burkholderia sp. Ac-20353 TaxID=2703894 RepID=UPI00197C6842|nr:DJ-1/PfpI family protein [Burkholderia sp. Ac-20353]MBN3789497.1 thiamine biosynthesis protein ThiJ [Burkholderia sp. Ac-20353]
MKVAMLAYDGFTDIDLFLPWDLFNRIQDPDYVAYEGPWSVRICSDTPQLTSNTGITLAPHAGLEELQEADAVFIVSGPGSRAKLADPDFMSRLKLNPEKQVIAGIDSGVLFMAKLGLLNGLTATTYPGVFPELEAMGVDTVHEPLVTHGRIATAGGCLAAQDLCGWVVAQLLGKDISDSMLMMIAKVE